MSLEDTDRVPPYLPFFWQHWRNSPTVRKMTLTQRAIFLEILIDQWVYGNVPRDAWGLSKQLAIPYKTTVTLLTDHSQILVCCQCGASWTPVVCQCGDSSLSVVCHNEKLATLRKQIGMGLEIRRTKPNLTKPNLTKQQRTDKEKDVRSSAATTTNEFDLAEENETEYHVGSRTEDEPVLAGKPKNKPSEPDIDEVNKRYAHVGSKPATPVQTPAEPKPTKFKPLDVRQWQKSCPCGCGITAERIRECVVFQLDTKANDWFKKQITMSALQRDAFIHKLNEDTPLDVRQAASTSNLKYDYEKEKIW